MRQPRTHSGSSLFLMELILAILFFSVASAVCVQLFARAHTASEQSAALNRAVLAAESAAESFKGADDLDEAVRLMGVRAGDTPGVLTAWYDLVWNPCAERDARYRLDILIHGPEGGGSAGGSLPGRPGGLWEAEITVGRTAGGASEELYRLNARRYQLAA